MKMIIRKKFNYLVSLLCICVMIVCAVFAQDASPADRSSSNSAKKSGGMMADSPVTFPEKGALPSKFPPDCPSKSNEAEEEGYYIFQSPRRSLSQIETIQSEMPTGVFTPPSNEWRHLERTLRILRQGGELRLLALGDSIVNDTMRSGWVAKLQDYFPNSDIQATVYVRGGGGCQHYKEQDRIAKNVISRNPDLVLIGGISQKDIKSIREVIRQLCSGLPKVEILLFSGTFGTTDPRDPEALAQASHSGTGEYGKALKQLAREEHCAYLDMTTPWAEYIRSSGLHPHRFYRDVVHANEYGEQILSKILIAFFTNGVPAKSLQEIHVSIEGKDDHDGSLSKPLRTISAVAKVALPGDIITVHEGTYRERITPPRGGTSDSERIVYQAAEGEEVFIKGSEVIGNWQPFKENVWKATISNSFFGEYNPYKDLIEGDWFRDKGRPHHTGAVYLNGQSLFETHLIERVLHPKPYEDAREPDAALLAWFCESDEENTYIYANFQGKNPNEELVEINVRNSCFYPDKPGCNYITIRGFHLSQAATQWAAPTAEQIGLIGTHWSKGWIIENNVIRDSRCSGITLGKDRKTGHNVWSNDPTKDGATHYNEVIIRALKAGWSKETIGSHIVRNNTIFNCGQTGICGSMGGVFSRIENNHIYDIWTKRQFTGAEMGGIKIHGAIDMIIRNNRIHNTGRGLWLDWMAQGTRVTRNLFYDNTTDDLFVEVNHGPFLVDNNIFLSDLSLRDWSEGGAYAHNLLAGEIQSHPELNRSTPYHHAHSTELMGLTKIHGGDNRFFNNIFIGNGEMPLAIPSGEDKNSKEMRGYGLWVYNTREYSLKTGGNAYFHGAQPYCNEFTPLVLPDHDPQAEIVEEGEKVFLKINLDEIKKADTSSVTTKVLGQARIPKLNYENADGSPVVIDTDYFGDERSKSEPTAGLFEKISQKEHKFRVW